MKSILYEKFYKANIRLDNIDAKIKKLLQDVEKLGEEGKIEESEELSAQVENFKKAKEELKLSGENPGSLSNKPMKVLKWKIVF